MPRIKRVELPKEYAVMLMEKKREEARETGDCAVIAISQACDVPYNVVHELLASYGRKNSTGTHWEYIWKAIKHFGFEVIPVYKQAIIDQYPGVHSRLRNITTHRPRRFRKVWAQFDNERILLNTHRHILCVKNGVVQDWTINSAKKVARMWFVRKIV